jgi:EAL domain-containing protein (putative c-di-GMP-specific phosphodiesterase class I)/DNA-binding NarL/FixJ family response regulator
MDDPGDGADNASPIGPLGRPGREGAPLRVLVVDDDPAVRAALGEAIGGHPDLTLAGATGSEREAEALAAAHRPDVAIVDVHLSGAVRGPAVTRAIIGRSPATAVLALSGHGHREDVIDMLRAGAVGYLLKSPKLDLAAAVRTVAEGRTALSPEVAGHVVDAVSHPRPSDRAVVEGSRIEELRAVVDEKAFSVVFQPVVDLATRRVAGVEALTRFPGVEGPPDQLFADAWDVGLGLELEEAVMAEAVARAQGRPPELFLALNVSPATASSARFGALVSAMPRLETTVVELTEHAPVDDYAQLRANLAPLRGTGLRLAVDDAGAGYASLRHVLELSPDFIKLDLTLVAEIDRDPAQASLAASLVRFAGEVGATVIAEGIESPAQCRGIVDAGVELGQGFLLGRPAHYAGVAATFDV